MIIYEVSFIDKNDVGLTFYPPVSSLKTIVQLYFSNKVKAKSFVAQNKKHIKDVEIIKHDVNNSKTSVLKFLNRNSIG